MGSRQWRKQNKTDDALRAVSRGKFDDLRTHAVPDEDDTSVHLINQSGNRIHVARG
jgi:hypothetical protein